MLHSIKKNNLSIFSNVRVGMNDTVDDQLPSLFLHSLAEVVCKYLLSMRAEQDTILCKHCV